MVKLFGEEIEVKAEICRLPGISGHADREGLLRWIQAFEKKPQQVFVVHGEDSVCDLFAERLQTEFGFSGLCAIFRGSLRSGKRCISRKAGRCADQEGQESGGAGKSSRMFEKLVAAGQRLIGVIRKNEGGANRDLERFAREIHKLCDRWER